jgi:Flp pilus assembly pilin Flp
MKLITWIMLNGGALLGILQSILKVLKELATLIIDLVSLVMPGTVSQAVVDKIRGIFNAIDTWIEKIKVILVK